MLETETQHFLLPSDKEGQGSRTSNAPTTSDAYFSKHSASTLHIAAEHTLLSRTRQATGEAPRTVIGTNISAIGLFFLKMFGGGASLFNIIHDSPGECC